MKKIVNYNKIFTFVEVLENNCEMKKVVLLTLGLMTQIGFAQQAEQGTEERKSVESKNMVKLNALALTTGTVSVQYERLVSPKITIGATVNLMPKRGLPFSNTVESFVDDKTTAAQLQAISMSSFSFTPEARIYFGKESFKGFYIAPFARIASYSLELPVDYHYEGKDEHIIVGGKISSFSGGIAFGAQWKLSDNIYLDWMIIGPHYGSANGSLEGQKALNQEEQTAINDALKDLDIPVVEYEYEVNSSGAKVKLDGPWAGVRAVVGIGYRF